jgi:hypothetical protein
MSEKHIIHRFRKFVEIPELVKSVMIAVAALVLLSGCRKRPDPVTAPQVIDNGGVEAGDGHIRIEFENKYGAAPFALNTAYINANGDTFQANLYKYYISNISLTREDDSVFKEVESYHLVDQSVAGSGSFEIHELPKGKYKKISFLLGVDSLRNVSGAQTGALDVALGMFWGWDTGYTFAKLEGKYNTAGAENGFLFHIGGFKGQNNNLRWFTLEFPEPAVVSTVIPRVIVVSDVSEWFKTPVNIDFSSYNAIMNPGKPMTTLVGNYIDMFRVESVEN